MRFFFSPYAFQPLVCSKLKNFANFMVSQFASCFPFFLQRGTKKVFSGGSRNKRMVCLRMEKYSSIIICWWKWFHKPVSQERVGKCSRAMEWDFEFHMKSLVSDRIIHVEMYRKKWMQKLVGKEIGMVVVSCGSFNCLLGIEVQANLPEAILSFRIYLKGQDGLNWIHYFIILHIWLSCRCKNDGIWRLSNI